MKEKKYFLASLILNSLLLLLVLVLLLDIKLAESNNVVNENFENEFQVLERENLDRISCPRQRDFEIFGGIVDMVEDSKIVIELFQRREFNQVIRQEFYVNDESSIYKRGGVNENFERELQEFTNKKHEPCEIPNPPSYFIMEEIDFAEIKQGNVVTVQAYRLDNSIYIIGFLHISEDSLE